MERYSKYDLYIVIGVIVVVNVIVLICVRRRMKRQQTTDLNAHVQTAVSQYFSLSGQDH